MTILNKPFKSSEVSDGLIPAGTVCAVIISKAELRPTSSGEGEYFWLQISVVECEDTQFIDTTFLQIINYVNNSKQAENIGRRQLKQITDALGIEDLEDTDQLLGEPFQIVVGVKAGTDGYPDSNFIKTATSLSSSDDVEDFLS
jgi:hypothetical protein